MKSLFSTCKGHIKENILLVAVWGAVIVTGFLALGTIVSNIDGLIVFGRIHSLAVRLSLVYTAVHIFRHRGQIMLRFGIKVGSSSKQVKNDRLKNNRAIKVVSTIVFHALLHMLSIHLAVAYTLFHIVQHRHGIFSLFKKLPLRSNAALDGSLTPIQLTSSMQAVPLAA